MFYLQQVQLLLNLLIRRVNNPNQGTDNNSETKNIKTEDIKEIFKVAYNYYELPAVTAEKQIVKL